MGIVSKIGAFTNRLSGKTRGILEDEYEKIELTNVTKEVALGVYKGAKMQLDLSGDSSLANKDGKSYRNNMIKELTKFEDEIERQTFKKLDSKHKGKFTALFYGAINVVYLNIGMVGLGTINSASDLAILLGSMVMANGATVAMDYKVNNSNMGKLLSLGYTYGTENMDRLNDMVTEEYLRLVNEDLVKMGHIIDVDVEAVEGQQTIGYQGAIGIDETKSKYKEEDLIPLYKNNGGGTRLKTLGLNRNTQ